MTKVDYNSPEAASLKTVTGWVSSTGHFFGDNEHLARYNGCTHAPCTTCGAEKEVRGYCRPCSNRRAVEKYNAMERKDWNGECFVCSGDTFFQDIESVLDHCSDQGLAPADLHLVICEPTFASQIDANEHYSDDLPEDGEVPAAIHAAFQELNKAIKACTDPLCWYPGDCAVSDKSIAELAAELAKDAR